MVKVIIRRQLKDEVLKTFKGESIDIFRRMKSLERQPRKGKTLGSIGKIIIKELKYKKYRFYFITDGYVFKFGSVDELASLLIKFVKMSKKKDQQQAIDNIKNVLRSLGFEGL